MVKREPYVPSEKERAEVSALKSFGIKDQEIAFFLNIPLEKLKKHFHSELELSSVKADAQVGRYLFSLASGRAISNGASHSDCLKAAIFWAKTRMRWCETNSLDVYSGGEKIVLPTKITIVGKENDEPQDG